MMHFFLPLVMRIFFSLLSFGGSSTPEEVEERSLANQVFAKTLYASTTSEPREETEDSLTTVRRMYNGLPVFSDRDIKRPKHSTNVGIDTNNPGNLMNGIGKGAIGVYRSSNGRYYSVFENVEDGYLAMREEIHAIKEKLKKLNRNMRLSSFLGGRILGKEGKIDKNSYYYRYAIKKAGGDRLITKLSDEMLAEIIMVGEGAYEMYLQGGKDFSHLKTVFINLEK